jgi:hypothetical protein
MAAVIVDQRLPQRTVLHHQQSDLETRRRIDALRDRAAERAQALDLPAPLLAPRRVLEALVRGEAIEELDGWRGQVLRELNE